jgi:hypothetical protein
LIKSLSYGKLKGADSLEYSLKLLVAKYPTAEVTPLANDILLSIKKQKNPDLFQPVKEGKTPTDTFLLNLNAEHFLVVIAPDDAQFAEPLKINIGTFNSIYYFDNKLKVTSNLFGVGKQLIVVKSFISAKESVNYFENLMKDPDTFKGDLKKELFSVFPISSENLPILYKKKNIESYNLFFTDNYKNLDPKK